MEKYIMIGCDLHDENMLLKIALDRDTPEKRTFQNNRGGRRAMMAEIKSRSRVAGGASVVFAYEASQQGFGLYDEITDAGFTCYILAPTRIARSPKHRRCKTDEKDAERILELVRGHVLAGNPLPSIWIPDKQARDDREIVRARLDLSEKVTTIKTQIQTLLKRNGMRKPENVGHSWTQRHRSWLLTLGQGMSLLENLPSGARIALQTLLRQLEALEDEIKLLDLDIKTLANSPRYREPMRELSSLKGVGILTAIVFLTEMGDLSRFSNRRQVGAFLGLAPSSNESGESDDRKGHITHQGPSRVTKVLCQATWSRVRWDPREKRIYERIVDKNPKHKKIAVVAIMRRLAVRMWHVGLEAQIRAGCFTTPSSDEAA